MRDYFNFNAGPAMLPYEVILRAREEIFDFKGTNISPLEIGHRSAEFQELLVTITNKLKNLLNVPNNYKIIYLQGGAQAGFCMLPFYYRQENKSYDYISSGFWSDKAIKSAKKYGNVNIIKLGSDKLIFNKDSIYGYMCMNETANGIMFKDFENPYNIPIINDMTSCITTLNIDISKFGIIYAASQKNLGIPGLTMYIVRDDLIETQNKLIPEVFNFKLQYEQHSTLNTISTYSFYIMDLMLDWIYDKGGVVKLEQEAKLKSNLIYDYIDSNDFYQNNIDVQFRSEINVVFNLKNTDLIAKFIHESKEAHLLNIKGHLAVGGVRVSLYNALPIEGVHLLLSFMEEFRKKNS